MDAHGPLKRLQWSNWFEALRERLSGRLTGPRLSDASISFDAAVAGQGITLVNELIASDELRSGQLVELLDTHVELGTYHLLHAPTRGADPVLQALKDWIVASIDRSLPPRLPAP